jgi:DNA mismatch repair ATPase MutS
MHACSIHTTLVQADKITFLYKIRDGVAGASFGLNVARLAGVPGAVVARAAGIAAKMAHSVSIHPMPPSSASPVAASAAAAPMSTAVHDIITPTTASSRERSDAPIEGRLECLELSAAECHAVNMTKQVLHMLEAAEAGCWRKSMCTAAAGAAASLPQDCAR